MTQTHNFNAGPAVLPAEVIARVRDELVNYQDTGISILESSHRSKEYEVINQRAITRLKRVLALDDHYEVGFCKVERVISLPCCRSTYSKQGAVAPMCSQAYGPKKPSKKRSASAMRISLRVAKQAAMRRFLHLVRFPAIPHIYMSHPITRYTGHNGRKRLRVPRPSWWMRVATLHRDQMRTHRPL